MVLAEGDLLNVPKAGKVTLLLSNGTLVTAQEETRMKIGKFEQEPFEANGRKVSDLEGEPSTSKVEIDLDLGSLVVKTKKLDKNSMFDINSPLGTAGIRGTEFQMGVDAGGGMQLDVTESTVAFTPPGGTPTPVGQGQGLDVSSTGAVSTRAVNPAVAQNVTATNEAAVEVSADVELDTVSAAMSESTAKSDSGGGDNSNEGDGQDGETDGSEPEGAEPEGAEPEGAEPEGAEPEGAGGSSETQDMQTESGSREGGEATNTPSKQLDTPPAEPKIDDVLENNPDAKQTRKTGKVTGASAEELSKFGMNEDQLKKFYAFSEGLQSVMILERRRHGSPPDEYGKFQSDQSDGVFWLREADTYEDSSFGRSKST